MPTAAGDLTGRPDPAAVEAARATMSGNTVRYLPINETICPALEH